MGQIADQTYGKLEEKHMSAERFVKREREREMERGVVGKLN
jgi:hypothetical protein